MHGICAYVLQCVWGENCRVLSLLSSLLGWLGLNSGCQVCKTSNLSCFLTQLLKKINKLKLYTLIIYSSYFYIFIYISYMHGSLHMIHMYICIYIRVCVYIYNIYIFFKLRQSHIALAGLELLILLLSSFRCQGYRCILPWAVYTVLDGGRTQGLMLTRSALYQRSDIPSNTFIFPSFLPPFLYFFFETESLCIASLPLLPKCWD